MKRTVDFILDSAGNAIPGALVYVYPTGSATLSTIYSDDGVTTQTNPMTTNPDGRYDFWVADGTYDIKVTYGTTQREVDNVQIYDLDTLAIDLSARLLKANNLADVADSLTARTNLGLTAAFIATQVPFSISCSFTSTPASNEVVQLYTFVESVTFPSDFTGSAATVGTNPTASFVLTVLKNGSSVGTITIGTGGAVTFSNSSTPVSFVVGDQLKVTAPSMADATVANVSITLKGSR